MSSEKYACAVLSDLKYAPRALLTMGELRGAGAWQGEIVYVCVDFEPDAQLKAQLDALRVTLRRVAHIPTEELVRQLRAHPLRTPDDNRHFGKLTQWDKLQLFDPWFKQWDAVLYVDAGMRIVNSVAPFFAQPWRGAIIAPMDRPRDPANNFACQLDLNANQQATATLMHDFGAEILLERYFLNCMWLYDTGIIDVCDFRALEQGMNRYPLCMTNEMALMNLYFTFKHKLWKPLQVQQGDRILFAWTEAIYPGKALGDFHMLKYPSGLK